ncbi:MAG: DUF424 family protein [Candidatus Thermoplasmatota archaeon]|nr:DUF424 family protein [Candidatus Thermoplasmatota archaeon]MCL5800277.1 DUF424 family protein [Candidatus Thermoplasmatota archaeon]
MKLTTVRGEVLLAAADEGIVGRTLREGKIHLHVDRNFYFGVRSDRKLFVNSLRMCTIANLVGENVVTIAEREGFVDRENVLIIEGVPYAQFTILER